MRSYSLEEARHIVMNCAKQYAKNLLNKRYIILYRDRVDNNIKDIEVVFKAENYQHLTGLELVDENKRVRQHVSELFLEKCIKNRLAKDEIQFKSDGTSNLKLESLPVMMSIQNVTKIAGDYNGSRPYLVADKLIGNVNFCLGLKMITGEGHYVPSSALLADIKKLTRNQSQVLAIFSKELHEERYVQVRHVAKGLDLRKVNIPQDVMKKISLSNYISKRNNYLKRDGEKE